MKDSYWLDCGIFVCSGLLREDLCVGGERMCAMVLMVNFNE